MKICLSQLLLLFSNSVGHLRQTLRTNTIKCRKASSSDYHNTNVLVNERTKKRQNSFWKQTHTLLFVTNSSATLIRSYCVWYCIRDYSLRQAAHNEHSECVLVYSHCYFKLISFYGSSLVHCQFFNKEISRCSIIQPKASKMKFIIAIVLLFVAVASGKLRLFEKLWKMLRSLFLS